MVGRHIVLNLTSDQARLAVDTYGGIDNGFVLFVPHALPLRPRFFDPAPFPLARNPTPATHPITPFFPLNFDIDIAGLLD